MKADQDDSIELSRGTLVLCLVPPRKVFKTEQRFQSTGYAYYLTQYCPATHNSGHQEKQIAEK